MPTTPPNLRRALLFDWGDTVMTDTPGDLGPMCDWPHVMEVEGVGAVLAQLRPQWRFALATNAQDSAVAEIRRALARVELDRYFEHIFCYRALGRRKQERGFWTAVLVQLGLAPESVVMVGDDFEGDVLAPNAVGIPAVWFNPLTEERRAQPGWHCTIGHMSELPAALAALDAGRGE